MQNSEKFIFSLYRQGKNNPSCTTRNGHTALKTFKAMSKLRSNRVVLWITHRKTGLRLEAINVPSAEHLMNTFVRRVEKTNG